MKLHSGLLIGTTLFTITLVPAIALASTYRLLEVRGTVQVKRVGESSYRPAREGMQLDDTHLVKTDDGAQARIRCLDGLSWVLDPGLERGVASGCPEENPLRGESSKIGEQYYNTEGGNDPSLPYIISPRGPAVTANDGTGTTVLNTRPLLRWNAVPGVTNYTVRVVQVKKNGNYWEPHGPILWEEEEVNGTEIRYPDTITDPDAVPLQRGVTYRVMVEADNGSFSELDVGVIAGNFQLLYENDISNLQTAIVEAEAAAQSLPDEIRALIIADTYISYDLFGEAISTLESYIATGSQSLEVYQYLGDFYRAVGLNLLAEERYKEAVALASDNNDTEGLANARAGLAEVKVMLAQPDIAIQLLTQAKAGYEEIADTERVLELQERLEELRASPNALATTN